MPTPFSRQLRDGFLLNVPCSFQNLKKALLAILDKLVKSACNQALLYQFTYCLLWCSLFAFSHNKSVQEATPDTISLQNVGGGFDPEGYFHIWLF